MKHRGLLLLWKRIIKKEYAMKKITTYSSIPGYVIVGKYDWVKGRGKTRMEAEKKMLESAKRKKKTANAIINLQVDETIRHNFIMAGLLVEIAEETFSN